MAGCCRSSHMPKERNHDPNLAHRKEQKKLEQKKLKKQRDERKEAQYRADPMVVQQEIDRLRHLTELRAEAGSDAKRERKIEELVQVKREAERRRAEQASEEAQFGPPLAYGGGANSAEVNLDISAITGRKRKADAEMPSSSSTNLKKEGTSCF